MKEITEMKEKWHGTKIKVGDVVVGTVENWKLVDKKLLKTMCELPEFNPIEYAINQTYSFSFYPKSNKTSIPYSRS